LAYQLRHSVKNLLVYLQATHKMLPAWQMEIV